MTDHRTCNTTMEARWRAMGFSVVWSDDVRGYVVRVPNICGTWDAVKTLRTVDEVEAFVVAHGEKESTDAP